jgi:triacylglycerol esterase/lipase EstA (alpha/beta hydrolase family)
MLKLKASLLAATTAVAVMLTGAPSASAQYHVPYGSEALLDFASAELFHPTTLAGANNGCKPSSAHPYPVVLVHGTLEDEGSNWVTLSPLLADEGYCVYAFNYGETGLSFGGRVDGLGHIPRSAEELGVFVNKVLSQTGASKVDLVGHSQGGMMPNYYIRFLGGASKVDTLIGLAPSNHGTTVDGLVTLINSVPGASTFATAFLEAAEAPALAEQEEGSAFMKKLFGEGEPLEPGVRYVVIETSHDEVVTPHTNAFLHGPGVTDILVQEQCPSDETGHIGMIEDSPALQNVLNQLGPKSPSFKARCENFGAGV